MKMMTKEKAAFVKKMQKAKEDKLELPKRQTLTTKTTLLDYTDNSKDKIIVQNKLAEGSRILYRDKYKLSTQDYGGYYVEPRKVINKKNNIRQGERRPFFDVRGLNQKAERLNDKIY